MNPWQMALQLRHELRTVTWDDQAGSNAVVFGSRNVRIFSGVPAPEEIPNAYPWALVWINSGAPDESDPTLIEQTFTIYSCTMVFGDKLGEQAIVGGPAAALTASAGRGIAEIARRVRAAVEALTGADGARIIVSGEGLEPTDAIGPGKHLAFDGFSVTAKCTSALHYTAPQRLAFADGTWTWKGAICSDRFDFLQYRLVRKSGSSPSTSPANGTTVYTGTAASFTGAQAGGNTYTCFADYNARGGDTSEAWSDPEVGSYLVVGGDG